MRRAPRPRLAAARTQLIQAAAGRRRGARDARAVRRRRTRADRDLRCRRLLQLPPEQDVAALDPAANPIAVEQNAAVEQAQAQLQRAGAVLLPALLSAGRGLCARHRRGDQRHDPRRRQRPRAQRTRTTPWASASRFPVFDFAVAPRRAKPRNRPPSARRQARSQQIATDLRAQWNAAVAQLQGARRVAANTPVQVSRRARRHPAGHRALSGRPRQHRRGGRSAAPAHAGGNRRRAGAARRLARPARRGRGRRRYPAVPGGGSDGELDETRPGSPQPADHRRGRADRHRALRRARRRSACRSTSSRRSAIPPSTSRSPTAAWTRRRWKATSPTTTSITSSTSPASITSRARASRAPRS